MRREIGLPLAAILAITIAPLMAQDEAPLSFDDIVGVWNMTYEDGETGTFTMSTKVDGTPKIMVTTAFGQSEARDIVIERDAIAFLRETNVLGRTLNVRYTAKLVDGKLQGTGDLTGAGPGLDQSTRFTATRAE